MHERLTKRNPDGGINVEGMTAALEKLAAWEDMQEQGRLVELPCKIGERVYEVSPNFKDCQYPAWVNDGKDNPCAERMQPAHCKACDYYRADKRRFCECPHDNIRAKLFEYGDIGKVGETVFLTAQEAETALKAMEAQDGA